MNRYLTLFLFGLVLFGCKKNPTEQPLDPCDPNSAIEIEITYPLIRYPVVNPENPDEIAFLRDNSLSSCCEVEILVYNQNTKELKSIYSEAVHNIEWGKNSWLFFDNIETQKVSKIKASGDSLTTIGSSYGLFRPKFNFDRTAFLAHFHTTDFSKDGYIILSQKGEEIKIFDEPGLASFNNWHHDSLILIVDKFPWEDNLHLALHSINGNSIESLPLRSVTTLNDTSSIFIGSDWLDQQTMIVSTEQGLYAIEFSGPDYIANVFRLRETCSKTAYGNVSLDRIGQKIITERQEVEEYEPGKFIGHIRFVQMNFDGSEEEIIEIDGL